MEAFPDFDKRQGLKARLATALASGAAKLCPEHKAVNDKALKARAKADEAERAATAAAAGHAPAAGRLLQQTRKEAADALRQEMND